MRSPVVALVVGGAYLSFVCGGCFSNQYVIPKAELGRLASLPPSQRGARVHVVQELGSRQEWAVDNGDAVPEQAYATEFADYGPSGDTVDTALNLTVNLPTGGDPVRPVFPLARPRSSGPRTWTPTSVRSGPRASGTSSSSGGGNLNLGNLGGGGGGGGDDLAIFAIVLVAVAVMAAAGLAVTEGLRYDGFVQLHPQQPLHLKDSEGGERTVPLADLTVADAAANHEATVMDDEAYGFRFGNRRPLDREGFAFKVDMGSLSSLCTCYSAAGFASNIQFGYFPYHRAGLLATLALGGGTSPLDHTFQRHSANLEAQFFPLSWWRLHLGVFAHGGMQIARDELGTRTGPAWGGGGILEIALTARLALTGRVDYTLARTAPKLGDWASTSTLTAGLAIY
jgi:hypothetical protein